MATTSTIPSPKTLPITGNLHQIPKAGLIQHPIAAAPIAAMALSKAATIGPA